MLDIPDDALTAEDEALAARIADLQLPSGSSSSAGHAPHVDALPEMDDIPDMDDEDDELGGLSGGVDEAEDAATASAHAAPRSGSKLLAVRTYDCLITYDKYYQVPRMWLVGYSESGSLLSAQQIFEDISPDYAQKTVTVEPFPHAPLHTASVHPCKHASVMRKVIERMDGKVQEMGRSERKKWKLSAGRRKEEAPEKKDEEEAPEGLRVDQYLLVFLKVSSFSARPRACGGCVDDPSCPRSSWPPLCPPSRSTLRRLCNAAKTPVSLSLSLLDTMFRPHRLAANI